MRVTTIAAASLLIGASLAATAGAASFVCGVRNRVTQFIPCARYGFKTLDNSKDPTFNQLLGINKSGSIAGYFGSGADAQHPNKGYTLSIPYGQPPNNYKDGNFPGSVQTQDIGINDQGTVVGFYVDDQGVQHGFDRVNGKFHTVDFPTDNMNPPMNNLLGVSNNNIAVGFHQDANGNDQGYWFNINSGQFHPIRVPNNVTADQATGVNNHRDISGFATINNNTVGFLIANGSFQQISYPNSDSTQALGVNDSDEVVGSYNTGGTANPVTHGFTWTVESINGSTNKLPVFQTVDAPQTANPAPGGQQTIINGLDFCGNLVGFYMDSPGNTHGLFGNFNGTGTANVAAAAASNNHHKKKKRKKKINNGHPKKC